ncbi:hypothetical protein BDN70DRAFT_714143 [Pholiota conissans]|uniref:Uncharacterized protein n=1 Tax=Pholiota conissans TaxID=109636 RepID=A0A9P5YKK2_9AGAR|nr:hypothetical protein BDN70DRAFT_714143 [Pholiota conissans]
MLRRQLHQSRVELKHGSAGRSHNQPGALQSHIDVLATDLLKYVAIAKNLEEGRKRAQLRASELEIAQTVAMARIQELEENLKSTGEELSSKIRDNDKLLAHSQCCRIAVADQCSVVGPPPTC